MSTSYRDNQFFDLSDERAESTDIIDFFNERVATFAIPVPVNFYFQANQKQKKQLIKISKIPPQFQEKMEAELLVQVNPEYFDTFNTNKDEYEVDNLLEILFDQEIDKIAYNAENGKISVKARNLKSSRGIIDKFSYEDVSRAEEIESLYEAQKKDQEL